MGRGCQGPGYLKNHTPTRTLADKTPFEMWYGRHPDVSHLHELGCKVWVHIPGENPKIYNHSIKCILVGYSDNSKAYHCLDWSSGRIHITCNTFFLESQDLKDCILHPGLTVGETDVIQDENIEKHRPQKLILHSWPLHCTGLHAYPICLKTS